MLDDDRAKLDECLGRVEQAVLEVRAYGADETRALAFQSVVRACGGSDRGRWHLLL